MFERPNICSEQEFDVRVFDEPLFEYRVVHERVFVRLPECFVSSRKGFLSS